MFIAVDCLIPIWLKCLVQPNGNQAVTTYASSRRFELAYRQSQTVRQSANETHYTLSKKKNLSQSASFCSSWAGNCGENKIKGSDALAHPDTYPIGE